MSINLVAAVMQVLQPELVTKIAGALGIEPAAAAKAVSAAVPAVLGGFARKAATPEGAKDLGALITAQSPDVRGQLGSLLGGNAQAEAVAAGLKLLERVLGGPAKDVLIATLGKYAGIDPQKIAGLLAIIAPIVTAILASYQRAGVGNGGGMTGLLASQQAGLDQSLPGRFASLLAETSGGAVAQPMAVSGSAAAGMATAVAATAAAVLARPDTVAMLKPRPAEATAKTEGPVAPPPPHVPQKSSGVPSAPPPPTQSVRTSASTASVPEQPIVERRRRLPAAAWLLPLVFAIAGAAWLWQAKVSADRELAMAAETRRIEEQKVADAARLKAEADAARLKAETDAAVARQKAELEAAAARTAEEARKKAEADASAQKLAAEAEAKRNAEADAVRLATEAENRRKAEVEAKVAAEAEAKRKADVDAAAQKAQTEAEARQKAEATARAAVEAKREAASVVKAPSAAPAAVANVANAASRPEVAACQKVVREVAASAKLQFDYASVLILDETPLVKIAASLKKCPSAHVRIEGHSDSNGDINRNQALSEDRAKAVADFLVSSGVAAERIATKGFGETRPLALNDTESNRALNRRIEIVIE